MKLIVLGSTGYHPNEHRHTACFMLPELGIVLDAGSGMFRVREHLTTDTLDIFLSHAHLDHVVGLTFLFDVLYGQSVRRAKVHGDSHKLAAIRQHLFSEALFPVDPPIEWCPLAPQAMALPGGGQLHSFPLKHPGGSLGFLLEWPGHRMAYVTDTTAAADADYVQHLNEVDLLVHECYFPDGWEEQAELTGHSCTTAVAEVARQARVRQLVLVHVNPLADDPHDPIGLAAARQVFSNTSIATDGMSLEF